MYKKNYHQHKLSNKFAYRLIFNQKKTSHQNKSKMEINYVIEKQRENYRPLI